MPKMPEMTISVAQARALESQGVVLKGATIHMTLGPNWKPIIWIAGSREKHCYYSPSHTFAQIKPMLRD